MVICLELGADLHMAQLMPLPLTICCFSKIQIGFTFLVLAHPGSPGQRAIKRVCVCVHMTWCTFTMHKKGKYPQQSAYLIHTHYVTPACSAHLHFTGLQPAVGLHPVL